MRRVAALALCLPLILAGGIGAHWLSYLVVVPDATARETLLAATGHAYATWLPTVEAILASIGLLTAAALVVGRRSPVDRLALRPGAFLTLPLVAWTLQEPAERAAAGYAAPLHVLLEPVYWRGLLFQVPFALVAFLVASLLLRVTRALHAATRARRERHGAARREHTIGRPLRTVFAAVAPRVRAGDALAVRGPPSAAVVGL
jgi:hypothetical protein